MDATFLRAQIATIKLQITAYNAAILKFAANGAIQVYRMDTGQSVIAVTRSDPATLQKIIDSLLNQLTIFENRLSGSGATVVRPGY